MKTHTNDFKNEIKEFGKEIDSKITYTIDNEEIELGAEDLNSITPHYEGSILKSVMRQLDIDSNIEIPLETVINYQFGLKIEDEYEYLNFGNYVVYNVEKQEDTNSYKITCYDKMLYSMKDYESLGITYPITVRNYINAVCTKLGLTFKNINDTFANYDKQIPLELYLDTEGNSLGYTFRDVLDELAQVTASTICINEDDDELEIRYINNTGDTINEEYLKDINVNFGEQYGAINTIVFSRAGADKIYMSYPEDLPEDQRIAVEIADNQILNRNDRDTYLNDILNKLLGLQYYLNDFSSPGICYYNLCDRYNVQIGEQTYSCVMFNDEVNVTQGLEENIHTEMPQEAETDYTKADKTDRRLNQTYFIVDKQNQTIESVVSQTISPDNPESAVNKVSRLTQKVDELESEISNITGMVTTNESTLATVSFTDTTTASEPITIKVYPIIDTISYLYPNSALYPSSTTYLKVRTIRFHNNDTNEDIDYVIPDDLLYYDGNNYDSFYLDLSTETCQIIKKCKFNADGTIGLLNNPITVDYDFPYIALTEGIYTVSLLGYNSGYILVSLTAKNIYTDQFYTKVETDSKINQKADEIELSVNQTFSNYSTTDQMNASINLKANEINSVVSQKVGNNEVISKINQTPEAITINANKLNLTGYVTASDLSGTGTTTINGSNITTGTIKSSNYVSGTSGTSINLSNGTIDTKGFKVDSSGNLTSTSGKIGGWNINNNYLQKQVGDYSFEIRTDRGTDQPALLVYKNQGSNQGYKFYVRPDGYLYCGNANISGNINASSGSFSGSIYSGYGSIGGWNISNSQLYGTASTGVQWAIFPYGVSNNSSGIDYYWGNIVRNASDKKLKNSIEDIDEKYDKFYDSLKPKTFFYNKDVADDKKHIGFIAQDVLKSEKEIDEDLSMVYKNPQDYYFLDKEEIVALNTWQIQKLKERLNKQDEEIALLKEEIKLLKEK